MDSSRSALIIRAMEVVMSAARSQAEMISFYRWFMAQTARRWQRKGRPLAPGLVAPMPKWLAGMTWGRALTGAELDAIESDRGIRLPADLRLFLTTVHCQRRRPSFYGDEDSDAGPAVVNKSHVLLDWRRDQASSDHVVAKLAEHVQEEARSRGLWLKPWGPRPAAPAARRRAVARLIAAAPRPLPLTATSFVVASETVAGVSAQPSPIFGAHPRRFEIWVMAPTIPAFLLGEFKEFLGARAERWDAATGASLTPRHVPFWSDLAQWCARQHETEDAYWAYRALQTRTTSSGKTIRYLSFDTEQRAIPDARVRRLRALSREHERGLARSGNSPTVQD